MSVLRVELRGEGSLLRSFELLKAKLEAEGLFARERKRLLPRFPQTVGIVSSSEAAGYGDFKKIALARLPGVRFILVNVAVQGKDAEREIVRGLDQLNEEYVLDAIVLIRGGGSLEDLHAFNSEPVARAIVRSRTPVVVGVGHERDITIADFCADVRAATPSNAAQLLLPEKEEVQALVVRVVHGGHARMLRNVQGAKQDLLRRLERIRQGILSTIGQHRVRTEGRLRTIEALSPERTLQRGYSLTWRADGSLRPLAKKYLRIWKRPNRRSSKSKCPLLPKRTKNRAFRSDFSPRPSRQLV
jgi:exodeoxyribonuclease VII large subunit